MRYKKTIFLIIKNYSTISTPKSKKDRAMFCAGKSSLTFCCCWVRGFRYRSALKPVSFPRLENLQRLFEILFCTQSYRGNNTYFRRWYWSGAKKECLPFIFYGQGGNFNNFLTKEHCNNFCSVGEYTPFLSSFSVTLWPSLHATQKVYPPVGYHLLAKPRQ